jgi:hypothetical protein
LLEAKKIGQCVMVLMKNVIATTIDDRFFQAQPYIILFRVVDDDVREQLLPFHTK